MAIPSSSANTSSGSNTDQTSSLGSSAPVQAQGSGSDPVTPAMGSTPVSTVPGTQPETSSEAPKEDVLDPNAVLKDHNPAVAEGVTDSAKLQKEETLDPIAGTSPIPAKAELTDEPDEPSMNKTTEDDLGLHKTIASENLVSPVEISADTINVSEEKKDGDDKSSDKPVESVAGLDMKSDMAANTQMPQTQAGMKAQEDKGGGFSFKLILIVLFIAIVTAGGLLAYLLLS